ncbi:Cyanovirin-N [Peziza echinospora]|nr:Cyanovirin-N [Peziza echinospora]
MAPVIFTQSCNGFELINNHILRAQLRKSNGEVVNAEIDLNTVLGNSDGWFRWGWTNFTASSKNIQLQGSKLVGQLTKRDQQHRELQGVELSEALFNDEGRFVFINPRP